MISNFCKVADILGKQVSPYKFSDYIMILKGGNNYDN